MVKEGSDHVSRIIKRSKMVLLQLTENIIGISCTMKKGVILGILKLYVQSKAFFGLFLSHIPLLLLSTRKTCSTLSGLMQGIEGIGFYGVFVACLMRALIG